MKLKLFILGLLLSFQSTDIQSACNADAQGNYYYAVLTDRSVNIPWVGWVGDHTAVEVWQCPELLVINKEYSFSDISSFTRLHSVQLMLNKDYEETYEDTRYANRYVSFDVGVSQIEEGSTSDDDFTPLKCFPTRAKAEEEWNNLISVKAKGNSKLKGYGFAEQEGFTKFENWRNSEYAGFGNNCNTFTRWLCAQCGYTWKNMWGNHPGNETPEPVVNVHFNYYQLHTPVPVKKGTP